MFTSDFIFFWVFLLTHPHCSFTQLESVQREGLSVNFKSITAENCAIGGWMDYPENASIIDPQEQQSDYYDRYDCLFLSSGNITSAARASYFIHETIPSYLL